MTTREQQFAYLQAMGIQAWQPRVAQLVDVQVDAAPVGKTTVSDTVVGETRTRNGSANDALQEIRKGISSEVAQPVVPAKVPVEVPAAASAKASPVDVMTPPGPSLSKSDSVPPFASGEEPPMPTDDFMPSLDMSEVDADWAPAAAPAINVSSLDWPELQSTVSACTACELHQSRTQTVFGTGSRVAEWMIIGEAPGAEEDQQGEPFVGPSGQLLNNMLRALGLQREQVFIGNILKCRPADDRDPLPAEIAQCEPYLQRQIALVAPKLILAMGGVAAHSLLQVKTPVTKLRGELHHYGETPLVVTYHPAYLLRKPSEKAKSWADLQFAVSVVKGAQQ